LLRKTVEPLQWPILAFWYVSPHNWADVSRVASKLSFRKSAKTQIKGAATHSVNNERIETNVD